MAGAERWLIVGSGRVGRALATGLAERGESPLLAGRRRPDRRGLPAEVRRASWTEGALPAAEVVLVAVPDREIASTARRLARRLASPGRRGTVLHTSGATPLGSLAPLAAAGWETGIFHVVAPFPPAGTRFAWGGDLVGLAGSPEALRSGRRLARRLRLEVFPLPESDRAGYHLGLSLAAAGLTALVDLATDRLVAAGLGRPSAERLVGRLATHSLSAWRRLGDDALTGAVARGDAQLVAAHLRAARDPGERELVRLLWRRALGIAGRSGRLSAGGEKALRRRLGR